MSSGGSRSTSVSRHVGTTPDYELQLSPSWIVFSGEHYKNPQYAFFKIKNIESVPIVYRIRTKKLTFPRFSTCHGYLGPNEEEDVVVVIPASDQWPGETNDMAGKRHRTVVENLIVPSGVEVPLNKKAAAMLSANIFKKTPGLTRMYTKFNILLPKFPEDTAAETTDL